jgi:hypothetical protein
MAGETTGVYCRGCGCNPTRVATGRGPAGWRGFDTADARTFSAAPVRQGIGFVGWAFILSAAHYAIFSVLTWTLAVFDYGVRPRPGYVETGYRILDVLCQPCKGICLIWAEGRPTADALMAVLLISHFVWGITIAYGILWLRRCLNRATAPEMS